jgi:hypothetical protein
MPPPPAEGLPVACTKGKHDGFLYDRLEYEIVCGDRSIVLTRIWFGNPIVYVDYCNSAGGPKEGVWYFSSTEGMGLSTLSNSKQRMVDFQIFPLQKLKFIAMIDKHVPSPNANPIVVTSFYTKLLQIFARLVVYGPKLLM